MNESRGPGNTADMRPEGQPPIPINPKMEAVKREISAFEAALRRIGDTEDGRYVAATLRRKVLETQFKTVFEGGRVTVQIPDDRALIAGEAERKIILNLLASGLDPQITQEFSK